MVPDSRILGNLTPDIQSSHRDSAWLISRKETEKESKGVVSQYSSEFSGVSSTQQMLSYLSLFLLYQVTSGAIIFPYNNCTSNIKPYAFLRSVTCVVFCYSEYL